MKRFLSIAMALCIGLTMSLDANAKRFGGGKSFGSAPSHQTRQAAPASPAAAPAAAGAAAKAGGASRWLGPLAGIAAGGLLASMFMGDGFQGMQIFDILIMAVIAFVIFRFIAARRRKQQADLAPAGHAPMQREAFDAKPATASIFGGGSSAAAPRPVINAPAWFTAGWPAEPMDGELWAGRGRFEQAQSAAARQQPDDAAWRALRYMVFDVPAHPGTFDERLRALAGLVARIDQPWVLAVPQRKVASHAELQALLRDVERGGGEGLMLRRGASLHRAGRGDDLLKFKSHDDAEARVVAHLPGKGKHAGRLGALLVETPEGKRFALGTGFTDAQRADPPPVGSWVTYRYRGLHQKSGLPRFASFMRVRADEARFRPGR